MTFVVQTMLVGGLLVTSRLASWGLRRHRRDRNDRNRHIQFGVGVILGRMAAIALILRA
jgi:hypothetical protein